MVKMLHGIVGGVKVTFPQGAATVTGAVFRQEQVPVTAAVTDVTPPKSRSAGAEPPQPPATTIPTANEHENPQLALIRSLLAFSFHPRTKAPGLEQRTLAQGAQSYMVHGDCKS